MSITSMLLAFLITFGVALVLALLILSVSAQGTRHRTKTQLLRDMFASSYIRRGPGGYFSPRYGNRGLGEWVNEEIEQGKHVHRPRGSRIKRVRSHEHK